MTATEGDDGDQVQPLEAPEPEPDPPDPVTVDMVRWQWADKLWYRVLPYRGRP